MTLPEFAAAQAAFARFNGREDTPAPDDAAFYELMHTAPVRASIH